MARPDLPALRRLLLQLIAPGEANTEALAELSDADWAALDAMAAQHRLQPLLHWRRAETPHIPASMRVGWEKAYRDTALFALAQRADLLAVTQRLAGAGIATIALKGAWLAWHAWPEPALRPMRDIDLLLADPAQAEAAWDLLHADGWLPGKPFEGDPQGKELSELVSPSGVALELHRHPWETPEEAARYMPPQNTGFVVRAVPAPDLEALHFPSPEDMFAHLVIHATYSHWLDAGPLLLGDIAFLLEQWQPDWATLWQRAEDEGWARGAALVLALVERWWQPGLLATTECPINPPAGIVAAAPDLLLQDLDHRRASLLAAEWQSRGGLLGRIKAHTANPGRLVEKAIARTGELASGEIRDRARDKIALRDWLAGSA